MSQPASRNIPQFSVAGELNSPETVKVTFYFPEGMRTYELDDKMKALAVWFVACTKSHIVTQGILAEDETPNIPPPSYA